jgi:hypothetical protein
MKHHRPPSRVGIQIFNAIEDAVSTSLQDRFELLKNYIDAFNFLYYFNKI